jgi:bifunctional UDP-N-acetylglucosamine pyrophosphorylase/glucosamine-1-phosphate N-acetyltransferase
MAAGLGTRMKSAVPKHFHELLGRRMVDWVLEAGRGVGADPLVVIASPAARERFEGHEVAVQQEPKGTGDAVRAARAAIEGRAENVLVLSGDTPLLTSALLEQLVETHRREGAAATILSAVPADPRAYGRIIRNASGHVLRIAEGRDATVEELEVGEINSSIYVFRDDALWLLLDRLEPHNVQGELYLTDVIGLLVEAGETVAAHIASDPRETDGVNTRAELAAAAAVLRDRINEAHMLAGVTILDPATTWIDPTVELEADAIVHPFTVLRGRTKVAAGAEIHAQTVAIDAEIGTGATVGPFCYLRPGSVLEPDAKAGTYVEIKNSRIARGAKVPHLSYIGDAEIGEGTNIGAGAITANYRPEIGPGKQRTTVGSNVRTGSDNVFMAPVTIGDGAVVAAGSVVTEDVPPGALAIARSRQVTKEGYAERKRSD